MTYTIFVLMSFSVFLAGGAAALRFHKISSLFYPFIFCTWLACMNEALSYFMSGRGISNIANNNIYILAEVLLINWQARRWRLFTTGRSFYMLIQLICVAVWLCEVNSLAALQQIHFYSRLLFGAVIIITSIHISLGLIISHERALVLNPVFLICTGYILFFILKLLVDAVWVYDPANSGSFTNAVYAILAWVNVLVNILFTIAIICIPAKPRYITL